MSIQGNQRGLRGRLLFNGTLHCVTGLHIGGGKDNMAIGIVDLTVVRDPLTRRPIIPGSSLKGKMRTLLAKALFRPESGKYFLSNHNEDDKRLKRLFGSSEKPLITSRLQFVDAQMSTDSVSQFERLDTDLYLTEIKYENTIDRLTSVANPRQMERVSAGSEFDFRLIYLIEEGVDEDEIREDCRLITEGLKLLQQDYLGGHGSRGSGRIRIHKLQYDLKVYQNKSMPLSEMDIERLLQEVENEGAALYGYAGVSQ
jgi:CRISPR-associated protein Csm3